MGYDIYMYAQDLEAYLDEALDMLDDHSQGDCMREDACDKYKAFIKYGRKILEEGYEEQ